MSNARRIVGVLVSIVVLLSVAEVCARLWSPFGPEYMLLDDLLGWRYRPGARYEFRFIAETACGWGSVGRMNSRGLRDREFPYEKANGTFRILALGDSFTAAVEHPVEATWTKVLERRLNAIEGGLRFEVVNAGRGAAGTGYEYLWYETEGWRYSPDLVLLVVIGNDITDNSRALAELQGRSWLWDPFYTWRDDGLILDRSFRDRPEFRWRRLTMPLRRAELIRTALAVRTLIRQRGVALAAASRHVPASDIASAIDVTKHLINALRTGVEERGARLAAFNGLPDYIWGLKDQPDRLMRELAADVPGLVYRDLVVPLDNFTARSGHRAYGCDALGDQHQGHWSREGNAEVARLIHEALSDEGLLPSRAGR